MTNVAISVGGVITPAGPEKAVGMLSTQYLKDPTDPVFKDDAGMKQWRDFMAKYMPGGDVTDASYVFAYGVSLTMQQVLKQCKGDFSRDNVMKQAESLHDFELPVLLPGIKVNTTHTDHRPITSMQFMKWDGKTWVRFGDLMAGATVTIVVMPAQAGGLQGRPARWYGCPVAAIDRARIDLLGQHGAGEEVRPGQMPERQHVIGARDHRRVQPFGAADQEAHRPAAGQPAFQQARQFLAVRHRASAIERHDECRVGQRGQQRLAFPPLHFGRRAARLGDLRHREASAAAARCSARTVRPPVRRAAGRRRSDAASSASPLAVAHASADHAPRPNHRGKRWPGRRSRASSMPAT